METQTPLASRKRQTVRPSSRARLGLRTIACALVAILGCASDGTPRLSIQHEHTLVPGQGHHPGIESGLLLPINATVERVNGLGAGDAEIMSLLTEYLQGQGIALRILGDREYRRAMDIAARKARKRILSGESGVASKNLDFSDVLPDLLRELEADPQIVILPNIVQRPGRYSGGLTVRWDGVRRRERGSRGGGMTGATGAASLLTMIYTPNGKRVFMAYGGLDLIFELDMTAKKYVLREDLFEDRDHLEEGVCVSLHPYFGDEVDC